MSNKNAPLERPTRKSKRLEALRKKKLEIINAEIEKARQVRINRNKRSEKPKISKYRSPKRSKKIIDEEYIPNEVVPSGRTHITRKIRKIMFTRNCRSKKLC